MGGSPWHFILNNLVNKSITTILIKLRPIPVNKIKEAALSGYLFYYHLTLYKAWRSAHVLSETLQCVRTEKSIG